MKKKMNMLFALAILFSTVTLAQEGIPPGTQGPTGNYGTTGINGPIGSTGIQGSPAPGIPGATGMPGITGPTVPAGTPGNPGMTGIITPPDGLPAPTGNKGKIKTDTKTNY